MVIEERDYRIKPGKLAAFIDLYQQHGLAIQLEYLGQLHGYFSSETGELDHVVAWWSHDSLDDRQQRRARMVADPRWGAYLAKVTDLLDAQHVRFLKPASFSPLR